MIDELQQIAATYGDQIDDSGSVAAKAHRGWMAVKDAIAGSDPSGVLDAAEQGEDHAVSEFDKALAEDISPEFKPVAAAAGRRGPIESRPGQGASGRTLLRSHLGPGAGAFARHTGR